MKRLIFLAILAGSLFVISSLLRSIYSLWSKQDLVVRAQNELEAEKEENAKLKQDLKRVESREFIEEEARNKLYLVRPGEEKVLLERPETQKASKEENQQANWEKWLDLFF